MPISAEERFIRAQARTIRHLENHVEFLQTMLYDATHEGIPVCDDPNCLNHEEVIPIQTRKEESVAPDPVDSFVKSMLADILT